ncbi:hypothetical protein [Janthinobacterium sp. J1-1]|uniref:hypothetical protein n=1 Tax=Janthinobacterium sp. J1-1 TaxID=3065910 RepID=UPI0028112E65|nr:hypothetical protein [Janthinobacterium sp. J1-1]
MSSSFTSLVFTTPLRNREWNKNERLALQNAVRIALPTHRASACLRHRLGSSPVTVTATKDGKTRLGGLMICDAHHVCPVCHHNKMARDKRTVAEVVAAHYAQGGFMVDAVFTVPHYFGEPLVVVLERLNNTWRALRSKSIWKNLSNDLGIVGCIRRLEVTFSANGWHPHFHVSFLCDWAVTKEIKGRNRLSVLDDAYALVAGRWSEAGKKAGIKVCMAAQSAVALVSAVDAAKAVAYSVKNMGFSEKQDSLTPIDLLRIIAQVSDPAVIAAAKRHFSEYATDIKGKHVLSFYGTARAAKTAIEDGATTPPAPGERLGAISPDGWRAVVLSHQREAVAQVKEREALTTAIMLAALYAGYSSIPPGWLTLTGETKTVVGVKGACPPKINFTSGLA